MSYIQRFIAEYIANTMIQTIITYGGAYIFAIYVLPEIGFLLIKSFSEN